MKWPAVSLQLSCTSKIITLLFLVFKVSFGDIEKILMNQEQRNMKNVTETGRYKSKYDQNSEWVKTEGQIVFKQIIRTKK